MSYQVLARKWRPKTFSTMVGQGHVLKALTNALSSDRLHHAYLFTGTRGVGKTTVARIFAKALNCEQGVTAEPCGTCSTCISIDEGRFVDLIEVDAASRTKVDETRELLENVQYTPSIGRYKVYLIDEVHMFSGHSFNALLKTLEEPPAHVKFLLATTDPKKLPITILSRCLQFNLKRLSEDEITAHLQHLVSEESISADEISLQLLARAADGSLRDALSLLDQASAHGGGELESSGVAQMLGTVDRGAVMNLLTALIDNATSSVFEEVDRLAGLSTDFAHLLDELLQLLQQLALIQLVPERGADTPELVSLGHRISAEEVQLYYQIALIGRRDLPLAPVPRGGFEMVLLRMLAFRRQEAGPQKKAGKPAKSRQTEPVNDDESSQTEAQAVAVDAHVQPTNKAASDDATHSWLQLIEHMQLSGLDRQLATHCALLSRDEHSIRLQLATEHAALLNDRNLKRLQQHITKLLGSSVKLFIEECHTVYAETPNELLEREQQQRLQAAQQELESEPVVQALKKTFGAQVLPDSIRPLDS